MSLDPPGFTGSPLDRADALRGDSGAVADLRRRSDARLLILDDYQPRAAEHGRLAWAPVPAELSDAELALLGLDGAAPRFVHLDLTAGAARRTPELFAVLANLDAGEAATYAAARSLADWHARHRFCANCGQPTRPIRAGWARACPACDAEHYPRTDPVVIMLAEHDGRALLGRQPTFLPGRYSALAGFVEVGESAEEAVRRELFEEAGVRAGAVRFIASQPWPFPSQLMLAFIAGAASPELRVERTELEDARWFTAHEIAAALAGNPAAPFDPPPRYAIARTLLSAWLAAQSGSC